MGKQEGEVVELMERVLVAMVVVEAAVKWW